MAERLLSESVSSDVDQEQVYCTPAPVEMVTTHVPIVPQGGPIETSHVSLPNKVIWVNGGRSRYYHDALLCAVCGWVYVGACD